MSGCFYWVVEIQPGRALPGNIIGIEAHTSVHDPDEARRDAIKKIEAKGQPTAPWHSAVCVYIGWAPRELPYGDWESKDGSWRSKA